MAALVGVSADYEDDDGESAVGRPAGGESNVGRNGGSARSSSGSKHPAAARRAAPVAQGASADIKALKQQVWDLAMEVDGVVSKYDQNGNAVIDSAATMATVNSRLAAAGLPELAACDLTRLNQARSLLEAALLESPAVDDGVLF